MKQNLLDTIFLTLRTLGLRFPCPWAPEKNSILVYNIPPRAAYLINPKGGLVAQSVERSTPGAGLIPALAARSLLAGSVSV